MVRIKVIPERLEDLAGRMSDTATQLRDLESRLGYALARLDWQVRQQANIEGQVHAARRQARALAGEAERLAQFLSERAQAFRQADEEGAQALEMTTLSFLAAARGVLPILDTVLSYMGAGRIDAQKFLDLVGIRRYGPLAPWLKIGILDQRYKTSKIIGKIGVGVGILSDIVTADEINERTIGVAVIRNVGEHALASALPPVGIALAGNAIVQMAGTGIVLSSRATIPVLATSEEMKADLMTSTDRLEKAFKRVDLGRITKDISEIVYDVSIAPRVNAIKAAWENPNIENLGRLFQSLSVSMPMTSQELQVVHQDFKKLGEDVFDFALGIPDLGSAFLQHTIAMGAAVVSKTISVLPLPDERRSAVQQTCERIIDFMVSHPITVEGAYSWAKEKVEESLPYLLPQYPPNASWLNSIQFAPVISSSSAG
jgi:uncharacterized protein YukE